MRVSEICDSYDICDAELQQVGQDALYIVLREFCPQYFDTPEPEDNA